MYKLHSQFLICCIFTQTEPENLIIFCRNECTEQIMSPHLCISSPRQWSSLKLTRRPRKVTTLSNTRSLTLSFLSPFLIEPASERLEIDSLVVFIRLLIWDVAEGYSCLGRFVGNIWGGGWGQGRHADCRSGRRRSRPGSVSCLWAISFSLCLHLR